MKRLGRYEVLAQIAEGGMAIVYAGRLSEEPSQLVALKVIRSQHARDEGFVKMFLDEAQITSHLVHPNIIRVHELGLDGKHHFLAMELVLGQTLAVVAEAAAGRGVKIPFEVAAWIGARVADGLHYAHELEQRGIVHRDVNPANVIITYDGRPKLIDFGLARAADRIASTTHGVVKGKLAYLSPEQAQGKKVDRQTDVFALGITIWELTTGRRLFKTDDDVSTVRRILTTDAPDPTTVIADYPPELAAAVMRALARDTGERWPTAKGFGEALDAFVAGRVDEARVAKLLATLFPADRPRSTWEKAIETVARSAARGDGFLAWDDGAQKMTWFQLEGGARESVGTTPADLAALLERRSKLDDAVTASRALLELAVAAEIEGDGEGAAAHARAALAKDPKSTAAHWILRRVLHHRARPKGVLEHLDAELAAASMESSRAALHGERARLLAAAGEPARMICEEYERALALRGGDPAALAGLESACGRRELPSHLARMAEALAEEPKLAAWLHVERARLLDAFDDRAGAAEALRAALALDPGLGPVRDQCRRRAIAQRDRAALVALLDSEALLEPDAARAAALELDAACIARLSCKDDARALALLARARARGAGSPALVRRIADALVEAFEQKQDYASARAARKARVPLHASRAEQAYELRASALLAERVGDAAGAQADLEQAHALDPADAQTAHALELLLLGDAAKRELLWAGHAARTADPQARADAFARAADVAIELGRAAQAVEYLRAASAAAPDDPELVERLATLLPGPNTDASELSARLAVYARAADLAGDAETRVAWLERVALLYEEAGDVKPASLLWSTIRRLAPERRSAMLGSQRTSLRDGDIEGYVSAVLAEAEQAGEPRASRLRLRAARALAAKDPERSLGLAGRDDAGLALAAEIHTRGGRWAAAASAIEARAELAGDDATKAGLLASLAEIRRTRLGAAAEALESLRAARKLARDRAGIAEEAAALAAQRTDASLLRAVFWELAESAPNAAERARLFVRTGELDELVLGDDAAALDAYARASEASHGEEWIAARRARVAKDDRRGSLADALAALDDGDAEVARAALEPIVAASPASLPALRALAEAARALEAVPLWANTLEGQIAALKTPAARLVALWTEAFLVEWRLPESGAFDVYERILAHTPERADRAALDGLVRRALKAAHDDDRSRGAAIRALVGVLADAPDVSMRLAVSLQLAALLEARGERPAALGRYCEALRVDPRSPTAAVGVARLADALRDSEVMVEAACALADLSEDPAARAALLVRAAGLLARESSEAPRARAAGLLEKALDADPTSAPALGALVTLLQDHERARLMAALRSALSRATRTDAVLLLATELARVARMDAGDVPLALSALERARDAAPTHAPTWLALAEIHASLSAWPEAMAAYEAAAEHAKDGATKKRALVALAAIRGRVGKPGDALGVLRQICDLDPRDVAAHRALVDALRAAPDDEVTRAEIAQRLERLAAEETTPEARSKAWLDLAGVRAAAGDRGGAEQAHARAVAESPTAGNLALVASTYGAPPGGPTDHARVLDQALARGAEIGRPNGAVFGALALLEIDALGRTKEGVAHARAAIALAPTHHEARGALARGLAQLGQHAEAVAVALPMFDSPESVVSLAKPDAFLDTLESSLHAAGRRQEALVARELRSIGGGVGDAAMVSLRARRLPEGIELGPPALPRATLWQHVLPPENEARTVLLEIAGALAAVSSLSSSFFPTELDPSVVLRGNAGPGHPLYAPFRRVAAALAVEGAELLVSDAVVYPRAVVQAVPLVVAPSGLAGAPEPVQVAAFARALARIVLGASWIDRARTDRARAFLIAGARVVAPRFGSSPADAQLEALIAEYAKPLGKAIGRAQKKALAALEPRMQAGDASCTREDVSALMRRVGQTELRAAFLLTGDLISTLDDLRASDGEYARAAQVPGPGALAATLGHPLAGPLARFALGETATELRRAAGTVWNQP